MNSNPKPLMLDDLLRDLNDAMLEHASAEVLKREAEHRMTAAINRVNKAQKALDAALMSLQEQAPWNTYWHSRIHPGVPA